MAVTKFVLSALTVASTAYAACRNEETTTIRNPSDISTCSTYSGNIAVATGAANAGTTDFGNIQKIDGDLVYEGDSAVQSIMLGSLEEITGDLKFSNLSALSSSGLGSLKKVGGDATFEGLSALSDLGLTAGLSEAGTITIINTNLQSFDGVANISKLEGLTISDNLNLGQISLDVAEIGMINIGPGQQSNGGQQASFRNLEGADSVVIRNCSSVDLGGLTNVTNDLRLIGNTFESFAAKNLSKVGALVINSNGDLRNISFPALEEVRSRNATLQIANNTKLTTIGGFPDLTTVTGDVYFYGNFSRLEFSSISRIDGAINVKTASTTFDCSAIEDLKQKNIVKGENNCRIGDKTQTGGSDTGTESDGSSESGSFASPLDIPAEFMSGFAILASLLSMFM